MPVSCHDDVVTEAQAGISQSDADELSRLGSCGWSMINSQPHASYAWFAVSYQDGLQDEKEAKVFP